MVHRPGATSPRARLRGRILEAFEARARQDGPRSVVMAELARDLGISTRTLYQHFHSKADIVRAMMERWAEEVAAGQQARQRADMSLVERIQDAAATWVEGQSRFSRAFWSQIRRDYPEAQELLNDEIRKILALARGYMAPRIREPLHRGLALTLLLELMRLSTDPKLCDRLGLARQDAVAQAIDLWASGALAADPEAERPAARVVPILRDRDPR